MTANPDGSKKCPVTSLAGWLLAVAATPGWRRRLLLAAAVILFVVALRSLWGGTDYRADPSLLVPRSAGTFAEVRDFTPTLAAMNEWDLWIAARRGVANHLQMEVAEVLAGLAPWLASRQTLSWLAMTEHAALATLVDGETTEKHWALYLSVPDAKALLDEMALELGQTLTPTGEGKTFSLSGAGGVTLHFAVVSPWLVVSSGALLPEFAVNSVQKPTLSLGAAEVLPEWARGDAVRMMLSPSCRMDTPCPVFGNLGNWVNPKARIGFAARVDGQGSASARMQIGTLADEIPGQGARALWWMLLTLLAVLCLAVILLILLMAAGWGGWLKAKAVRAGVTCADRPAEVEPSSAFREDSGDDSGKVEAEPAPASDPEPSPEPPAPRADDA